MKTPLKKPTTKTIVEVRPTTESENILGGPNSDILSKKPLKKTKVL